MKRTRHREGERSPYRAPPQSESEEPASDQRCPDGDIAVVVFLLWVASIARVVTASVHRETFGTEASLAAFAVIFGPFALREPFRWFIRTKLRRKSRGETPFTEKRPPEQ